MLRRAIEIYLGKAYDADPPRVVLDRLPPPPARPEEYLMSRSVERSPAADRPEGVRSFAIRLGNAAYPHMKLRLSRAPGDRTYLFSVDSHDAFLDTPAGSPERQALERLKCHNAEVSAAICAAWDRAGVPTERAYLRQKIRQAKEGNSGS